MNKQITFALLLLLRTTLSLFSQNEVCQIEILNSTFPNVVSPGQTVNFEATVKNIGTTMTIPTNIGLYQFLGGSSFPGRRPNLKANVPISNLAPNEEKTVRITVTMDSPLYNRSTIFLNNNEFALIIEEDAQDANRWFNCNLPVEFDIDFQEVDLALTVVNDLGCIGADNLNQADLQLKNLGNTTVKAPIYINVGGTSFANENAEGITFFFPSAVAYWIIQEDMPPGTIRSVVRPFKTPGEGIEEWTNNASIDEFLSNIEDTNSANNSLSKTFIRTTGCDGTSDEACPTNIISVDFPTLVSPSERIEVTVTIKNNSITNADTATLGLYQFSRGLNFPGPFPELRAAGTTVILAANETKTVTFELMMPDYFQPYPRLNFEGNSFKWVIMTQEAVDNFFLYKDCFFEVNFDIQYPEINLGIRLIEKAYCIGNNGRITLDYEVKNEGNTVAKAPLFVGRSLCFEFRRDGLPGLCLQQINEDLAPNQSVIIQQSYNYYEAIFRGRGNDFSAYINDEYSNITNTSLIENAGKNISEFDFCESSDGAANCDAVGYFVVEDEIRLTGLLTDYAKVEIIGANTDWQIQVICDGNCDSRVIIPNLEIGEYTVKVQLNSQDGSDCYREEVVIIESDGGNNGGSNSGDNPAFIDCDQLQFIPTEGQIEVQNILPTSKIEIIGANTNWQIVTICEGDCSENQVIPNLSEGEYTVKVNQFGANGEYCYREEQMSVTSQFNICNHPDFEAMKAFAQSLQDLSGQWNWSEDNCDICNWDYVSCNDDGRVEMIALLALPLKGNIPSTIGDLTYLRGFTLTDTQNRIISFLPKEIEKLTRLESLIIQNTRFPQENVTVQFPDFITNISSLVVLELNGNNFGGEIPKSITNLTNLQLLNLSFNKMSGVIPDELGNLKQLSALYLQNNFLEGSIPKSLGELEQLQLLIANQNDFSGTIPKELGNLTNIRTVNFTGRESRGMFFGDLSGCFPNSLKKWCSNDVQVSFSGHSNLSFGGDFNQFCNDTDTACNDGGSKTENSCDALDFRQEGNEIIVENINLTSKIEIIGANTNWQIVLICDGDCNQNQTIPNLSEGEYAVKVNQFGVDGSYCYREEKVQVGGDNGEENNNADFTCEELNFTSSNGQIFVANLNPNDSKVEYIGRNTDWIPQLVCEGNCQSSQTIPNLSDGVYTVKVSQRQGAGNYCYREMDLTVGAGSRATREEERTVAIFPNPVKNNFFVDVRLLEGKKGSILVYNSYGQIAYENRDRVFQNEFIEIDGSQLENGLYYLFLNVEGRRAFSQKLVKESYK